MRGIPMAALSWLLLLQLGAEEEGVVGREMGGARTSFPLEDTGQAPLSLLPGP